MAEVSRRTLPRNAERSAPLLCGHAWIRQGDWEMASEEERTQIMVMMIDALMVHAPGAGPGQWLQWRAIVHPSGDIIVVLECTWRAW